MGNSTPSSSSAVPSPLSAESPDMNATLSAATVPSLNAMRWRATMLSQRLLRRERQCVALREALQSCNAKAEFVETEFKKNHDWDKPHGEHDRHGRDDGLHAKKLEAMTPCAPPVSLRAPLR